MILFAREDLRILALIWYGFKERWPLLFKTSLYWLMKKVSLVLGIESVCHGPELSEELGVPANYQLIANYRLGYANPTLSTPKAKRSPVKRWASSLL